MSDSKASFLGVVKRLLRDRQIEEEALLARLTPDAKSVFTTAAMTSWVPRQYADEITATAAIVLFADQPRPVYELGRAQARNDLTGIYKILLRVVSVEFAMGQTAKLWSTYHNRGQARAEKQPDRSVGAVVVNDYPDFSEVQIESTAGYIHGLLELTGAAEVKVHPNTRDRRAIRFETSWS